MRINILFGVAAVILLLIILVSATSYLKQNQSLKNRSTQINQSPTPSLATPTSIPTSDIDIPEDWVSYKSENLGVTLKHLSEVSINEYPDGTLSFFLWGPTQKEATELYDGFSINIVVGTYNQSGFEDFVQEKYEEIKNDPVIQNISPLEKTSLNGKEGFKFTVSSLGEFDHIYLPKKEGEFFHISSTVSDPTDQGFKETVDKILSTLEF